MKTVSKPRHYTAAMSSQLLMIEDDARLAQMVGEYLGQSGLQVTHRADGKSGLAQLQGPDAGPLPDLVILDLMLPDMDGLEAVSYTHLTLPTIYSV